MVNDCAKQFMAFMALKGYEDLIAEAERYSEPRLCLSEDQLEILNRNFGQLQQGSIIRVSYYADDSYVMLTGTVGKINLEQRIIFVNTESIFLDDIVDLEVVSR
ncbi:MAG: hypothetical protein Q4D21_08205 [Phascolarctobacterium sp.]|nr:hypothetical protein [Phascolarctobacterium sp.]